MNAEPLVWALLGVAVLWAAASLINRAWRWLFAPRGIVKKAREYRWPAAKRRER